MKHSKRREESTMGLRRLTLRLGSWFGLTVAVAFLGGDTSSATAQNDLKPMTREQRLSDPIYMSWLDYKPVSACISCHVNGPSEADIESGRSDELTAFSRQEEMMYWLQKDKHTIARSRVEPFSEMQTEAQLEKWFERLNAQVDRARAGYAKRNIKVGPAGMTEVPQEVIGESNILSRRICDKLWGANSVTTVEGYNKFRDNCLTCHGGYHPGAQGFDLGTLDNARLGIDCLYCHQDGNKTDWVEPHQTAKKWRMRSPTQKAAAGLRPLATTSVQADLCMDCHVGNRDKNMFVTHEMYAAGHPPIPSIELQEFSKEMPQHWQAPGQLYDSLEESGYGDRDRYFAINYPGVAASRNAKTVFWNTRKMLLGALTARKKTLSLLVDSADSHRWADYSMYDCAACHHELNSRSYRQYRGFPAAPGRPRQHEWPDALLQIAYAYVYHRDAAGLANTRQLESSLVAAIGQQPFGDPNQVRPIADQFRAELDRAITVLEQKPFTAGVAKAVLTGLSQTNTERLLTYDSARQVVWAMQTIVREMEDENAPLSPQISMIVKSLGQYETAGIEAAIPSGRKAFIYPKSLDQDLQRRAVFNPARLRAKLQQIRQLLTAANSQNRGDLVSKQ